MAPNEAGSFFFPTDADLANILGDADDHFDIFDFLDCWIPYSKILGFLDLHLASLTDIQHIWESRSQQVSIEETDLSQSHGHFCLVMSQAV